VVFGKRAGKAAAEHSSRVQSGALDAVQLEEAEREMLAPFERPMGNPLRNSPRPAGNDAEPGRYFRNEEDLQKALGELEKFKHRLESVRADGSRMFNPGWHLTRDLRSMVLISEAVTRSALARRESRGRTAGSITRIWTTLGQTEQHHRETWRHDGTRTASCNRYAR